MFRVNGFFGHVKHHGLKSILLMGMFFVAAQVVGVALLVVPVLLFDRENDIVNNPAGFFGKYGVLIILVSCILFLISYLLQARMIKSSLDLFPASQNSHPRLYRAVNMISQTAGIPFPELMILNRPELNAFAMGNAIENPCIVITQGLYEALDDQELEAVIAHEISHIAHYDLEFMAIANAATQAVEMLYNFKWLGPFKYLLYPIFIFMPVMLIFYFLFVKLKLFGKLIALSTRLLISTSREYIADAEAVRLTHNPAALASALRKVQNRSKIEGLDPLMDVMMIDGDTTGNYASHPTIAERIAKLARFSGSMMHDRGPVGQMRYNTEVAGLDPGEPVPAFGRRAVIPESAQQRYTPESYTSESVQKVLYLANLRIISLIIAICMRAMVVAANRSKSFAKRRLMPSQAKVLSTIHRFGRTSKPA